MKRHSQLTCGFHWKTNFFQLNFFSILWTENSHSSALFEKFSAYEFLQIKTNVSTFEKGWISLNQKSVERPNFFAGMKISENTNNINVAKKGDRKTTVSHAPFDIWVYHIIEANFCQVYQLNSESAYFQKNTKNTKNSAKNLIKLQKIWKRPPSSVRFSRLPDCQQYLTRAYCTKL